MPKKRKIDSVALAKRNWEQHGWSDAALGMAALTSVIRSAQLLKNRAEQLLKPFGVSFSRYELLALLMFSRQGALPMSKVSSRLNVPAASVTHSVTQLERSGLVERLPDPQDGRGTLVAITDQGIALVGSATNVLNGLFVSFGLSEEESATLYELLRKVRADSGDTVS